MTFNVNILALVLGMVLNMGLGMLWYSPVLFAKPWMKEAGITQEEVNDTTGMGMVYGLTFLTALITSYVIGFIITNFDIDTVVSAILVAVIVWLGTDLSSLIKNWGFEKRTMKLGIINHSYDLTVYVLVSIIFVVMK